MSEPIPMVVEETARGERSFDLYSRLLQDRIVIVGSPIDDAVANLIIAQLIHLEAEDPEKEVKLYINSPGGSASALLGIYDTMRNVRPEVSTTCVGQAASAAAVLLAAGTAGKRFALPHARVLIHQPRGELDGQAADIEIHAREAARQRRLIDEILARHTGQPVQKVHRDTDRDFILTAGEAKEYGIIDDVLATRRTFGAFRPSAEGSGNGSGT